jgi:hemoglobin
VLQLHAMTEDLTDLGRRFVSCFLLAADDAALPDDADFRAALEAYMQWAVDDVLSWHDPGQVPSGTAMPHWSWDGLQPGA